MNTYWTACQNAYDAIKDAAPQTAAEVVAILLATDPTGKSAGDAFWSSDEDLLALLQDAGWGIRWYQAAYYWQAKHPQTGSTLTLIEGDVYADQDLAPLP